MKKIAALLLALTMVVSIASCGDKNESTTGNTETTNNEVVAPKYTSTLEILNATWNSSVWDDYRVEDEDGYSMMFYAAGGDSEHPVDNAPGKFHLDIDGAADTLEYMTKFPSSEFSKIDDAATLMHMLNANTFTASAYHFTNESDIDAGIEAIKTAYANQHWMCGFPEVFVVFKVPGNYVVSAYGNEDLITRFKNAMLKDVENAELVHEEVGVDNSASGADDDWWALG